MSVRKLLNLVLLGFGLLVGWHSSAAIIESRTNSFIVMHAGGNVRATVLSLNLPAGEWLILGKVAPTINGARDIIRCQIKQGSIGLDSSSILLGTNPPEVGQPHSGVIVVQSRLTTTANTTVALECWHDNLISGVLLLDSNASLVATNSAGPQGTPGLQGPQGPVGPSAARTVAVCTFSTSNCTCWAPARLITRTVGTTCNATSDTGSCYAQVIPSPPGSVIIGPIPRASCCVCAP